MILCCVSGAGGGGVFVFVFVPLVPLSTIVTVDEEVEKESKDILSIKICEFMIV